MSYLGFCGTLGADYMQYMIADHTLVPQESRRFYTEKMMYMPHSYFVNDHKQARHFFFFFFQILRRIGRSKA